MKSSFSLFTAAAAVVAAMVRQVMEAPFFFSHEQASELPRMTPKLVEQYAYVGATDQEIADRFLVDVEVVHRDFAPVLRVARAMYKIQIRSLQLDTARKFNGSILMWLGRNLLGQTANPGKPGDAMPEIDDER